MLFENIRDDINSIDHTRILRKLKTGTLDEDGELNRSEMADELAALKAEQEMSVEELRRKHGGGGDDVPTPKVSEEKVVEKNESTDAAPEKKKKKKVKKIIKKIVKKVIKVKRKKKRKVTSDGATEESNKKAKIEVPSTNNSAE